MNKHAISLLFMFILGSFSMLSCNSLDDQLKHQAEIQGEAQAVRQTAATKVDNEQRAALMQRNFEQLDQFYSCLAGQYEGKVQLDTSNDPLGGDLDVVVTLYYSHPTAYASGRPLTETEIVNAMSAMSFKAVVEISNPTLGDRLKPSTFEGVQADQGSGKIDLVKDISPNQFHLWVMSGVNGGSSSSKGDVRAVVKSSSKSFMQSLIQGGCRATGFLMEMTASNISAKTYGAELHRSVGQ